MLCVVNIANNNSGTKIADFFESWLEVLTQNEFITFFSACLVYLHGT